MTVTWNPSAMGGVAATTNYSIPAALTINGTGTPIPDAAPAPYAGGSNYAAAAGSGTPAAATGTTNYTLYIIAALVVAAIIVFFVIK